MVRVEEGEGGRDGAGGGKEKRLQEVITDDDIKNENVFSINFFFCRIKQPEYQSPLEHIGLCVDALLKIYQQCRTFGMLLL